MYMVFHCDKQTVSMKNKTKSYWYDTVKGITIKITTPNLPTIAKQTILSGQLLMNMQNVSYLRYVQRWIVIVYWLTQIVATVVVPAVTVSDWFHSTLDFNGSKYKRVGSVCLDLLLSDDLWFATSCTITIRNKEIMIERATRGMMKTEKFLQDSFKNKL